MESTGQFGLFTKQEFNTNLLDCLVEYFFDLRFCYLRLHLMQTLHWIC